MTRREFAQSLSKALRLLRESRNLSQAELARRLDIDRATMNRYEAGSIRPGVERLAHILEVLKVTWADFGEALEEVRRAEAQGHTPSVDSLLLESRTPDDDLIAAYVAAAARGRADEFVDSAVRKTRHLVRWRKRMKTMGGEGSTLGTEGLEEENGEDPDRLTDLEDLEKAEPGR